MSVKSTLSKTWVPTPRDRAHVWRAPALATHTGEWNQMRQLGCISHCPLQMMRCLVCRGCWGWFCWPQLQSLWIVSRWLLLCLPPISFSCSRRVTRESLLLLYPTGRPFSIYREVQRVQGMTLAIIGRAMAVPSKYLRSNTAPALKQGKM
jgi:hypothetical protein